MGTGTPMDITPLLNIMSNNLFQKLAKAMAADQNPILMVTAQDLREFAISVAEEVRRQIPTPVPAGGISDDDGNENDTSCNRILTARETIDLLKISLPTLWRWGKKGYLVPIQVGDGIVNQRRYRYADVMRIINKGKK